MEIKKNVMITFWVDDEMNKITESIIEKIVDKTYPFKNFDSFMQACILSFLKLLDNHISPIMFDEFINSFLDEEETKSIDA